MRIRIHSRMTLGPAHLLLSPNKLGVLVLVEVRGDLAPRTRSVSGHYSSGQSMSRHTKS